MYGVNQLTFKRRIVGDKRTYQHLSGSSAFQRLHRGFGWVVLVPLT
jgi:hypothetical protein